MAALGCTPTFWNPRFPSSPPTLGSAAKGLQGPLVPFVLLLRRECDDNLRDNYVRFFEFLVAVGKLCIPVKTFGIFQSRWSRGRKRSTERHVATGNRFAGAIFDCSCLLSFAFCFESVYRARRMYKVRVKRRRWCGSCSDTRFGLIAPRQLCG